MAKQHYLFLDRFNNYFNRKIIKYDKLNDYMTHSRDNYCPLSEGLVPTSFDFNPNDNITTEVICNGVPFDPDYILIFDDDVDETIASRWFIVEQKRNRQGQWIYYLKRDVIADNLDSLLNAPIFVEKGMLNENDPFIVNNEGMSLNQVKVNETKLLDKSNTAWIVGYMARNIGGSDINIQVNDEQIPIDYITLEDIATDIGVSAGVLSSLINFDGDTSTKAQFTNKIKFKFAIFRDQVFDGVDWFESIFPHTLDSFTNSLTSSSNRVDWYLLKTTVNYYDFTATIKNAFPNAIVDKKSLWLSQLQTILNKTYYMNSSQLEALRKYEGRIIRYNGKYYNLSLNDLGTNTEEALDIKNNGVYSALTDTVAKAIELSNDKLSADPYDPTKPLKNLLRSIKLENYTVAITLNYISDSDTVPQLNTVISSGRKTTQDQEYDIFAIPLNIYVESAGPTFSTKETYARRIASAIGLEEDAKVYDIQLLPYCPLPDLIINNNRIDITNLTEHQDFDYITKNTSNMQDVYTGISDMTFTPSGVNKWTGSYTATMTAPVGKTVTFSSVSIVASEGATISGITTSIVGNNITVSFTLEGVDPSDPSFNIAGTVYYYYSPETTNCGIIFYIPSATFSTTIDRQINSSLSKKTVSNCKMWRLVSPNYQGAFEFNIAKNGGSVAFFNVFCTYKPYTPIIKVAPNFSWLYGQEFQDNRGLICGGDYSLPRVSDAWISYQLNNKNYQNIFNREIEHLDFMQSLEMRNQLVSGAVGIFSDAVKGAGAGAMVGGGWGALAGAVVGAGASAVGYGIDVDTMARTHRENKQLAIDKFNYQLGNVKALPYTLTKVGSFDAISKIFPFVEEYSCTEEELEAFENKIRYESMTVMRIGTIAQFKDFDEELHYFKGSLIRNDEIADDSHVLNAIYEELLKGVYI